MICIYITIVTSDMQYKVQEEIEFYWDAYHITPGAHVEHL
jgi:hypothetical protein